MLAPKRVKHRKVMRGRNRGYARAQTSVQFGDFLCVHGTPRRPINEYLFPDDALNAPVSIDVWVTEIRGASFTLAHEVYDENPDDGRRVYLRARSVLTPYSFAHERPRRLSPGEQEVLQRFPGARIAAVRPVAEPEPEVPDSEAPDEVKEDGTN